MGDSDDSEMPHLEGDSTAPGRVVSDDEPESEEEADPRTPDELKAEGNAHYKKGEYRAAIELYTMAIHADGGKNPAFLNNRAAALMMLLDYPAALADATKAAKLEPTAVKYKERMAKCYS